MAPRAVADALDLRRRFGELPPSATLAALAGLSGLLLVRGRRSRRRLSLAAGAAIVPTHFAVTHDAAERRPDLAQAVDAALREERHLISAILEHVQALIVVLDTDARIVRWNRACEQVSGYSAAEAVGRNVFEFPGDSTARAIEQRLFRDICEGRFPIRYESDLIRKDGGRRRIEWSATGLTDSRGDVKYLIGLGVDITERDRAERAAARRAAQAAAIARVGHEALLAGGPAAAGASPDVHIQKLLANAVADVATTFDVKCAAIFESTDKELRFNCGVGWRADCGSTVIPLAAPSDAVISDAGQLSAVRQLLKPGGAFAASEPFVSHAIVSGATVAIPGADGRAWGTIGAYSPVPREFDEDDSRFLESIANLIAAAISRSRAENEVRLARDLLETHVKQRTTELVRSNAQLRDEINQRRRAEILLAREKGVLELIARGAVLSDELSAICGSVREQLEDTDCSIRLSPALNSRLLAAQLSGASALGAQREPQAAASDPVDDPHTQLFAIVGAGRESLGEMLLRPRVPRELTQSECEVARSAAQLTAIAIERKRTESEIRRQKEFVELLIRSSVDGILAFDLERRYTLWNPAMERITGVPQADVVGRIASDVFPAARDASERDCLGEVLAGRPAIARDKPYAIPQTGRRGFFEGYYAPLRDEQAHVTGGFAIIRDTTDRKNAEQQSREHLEELAHVSRLSNMGELASGFAHELNQPLCAIVNYTEACLNMLTSEHLAVKDLREAMVEVADQAERAGQVIRHLRDFIRTREPNHSPVDLNEIIHEVAALARPEAEQFGALVELRLAETLGPVLADVIQIEQVLLNLIRNALEAMHRAAVEERTVSLSTTQNGERVEIVVRDTGPGVPEAAATHIFDPFFSTKKNGMGMGLSIGRSIIEAHGGRLWIEGSSPGGAEFHLTLPKTESEHHDED